ncbi:MAG: VWA domain-containing protein [Lentisphaeria bacterium]|nr:VWA domain-containing protein [Lentisphaeria bacterium]
MIFASSWAFLLLVPYLFLMIYLWRGRHRQAIKFPSLIYISQSNLGWRSRLVWLPSLLIHLALLLFIVALARPQILTENSENQVQGISIQLVLDLSSSMDTYIEFGEETISRLEVSKKVIAQFVNGNEKGLKGRPNDLIGLLTFARYADTICPLTFSHKSLVYLNNQLETNTRPHEDGTAFGDAVALAAARLKKLHDLETKGARNQKLTKTKIIILLTDGENNCGKYLPLEAAMMAKKWGIRLYTISLGEDVVADQKVTTNSGEKVSIGSSFSEANKQLIRMAKETGGIFRTAHDYDSLEKIYSEIDGLEKSKISKVSYITLDEYFRDFLRLGLLFLIVGIVLNNSSLRRVS